MTTNQILILIGALFVILGSFGIGFWAKSKVKSSQDFFGATALFGPVVVSLSTMAAVASAFALVGVPGIIYFKGNTMNFWMLASCSFALSYIIIGKKVRAMAEVGPISSLGDISDLRFNNNKVIKLLMSLVLFFGCIMYLSSQVKAGAVLFNHLFQWPELISAFVIFGILVVYTIISGEVGGLLTQAFQGFIMVISGIIIIIGFFVITDGGGFGTVLDIVSSVDKIDTKKFGPDFLNGWGSYPIGVALMWVLIPIAGVMGQPQVLTRMYALKDPHDMPKTTLYGSLAHMIVGFVAIVIAYGAIYLVAKGDVSPLKNIDSATYIFADKIGIIGQMFIYAAVLAAAMSSASLFLTLLGNIIARDIPSSLNIQNSPEKQILISRISMAVIGVGATLFAIISGYSVAELGTFGWGTLMASTFPVFIIGLLWKRANGYGVISGLSIALVCNIVMFVVFLTKTSTKAIQPSGIPWYAGMIMISIVVTVVVSLATKEEKVDEKIDEVFNL